jgi:hypothetical protein
VGFEPRSEFAATIPHHPPANFQHRWAFAPVGGKLKPAPGDTAAGLAFNAVTGKEFVVVWRQGQALSIIAKTPKQVLLRRGCC